MPRQGSRGSSDPLEESLLSKRVDWSEVAGSWLGQDKGLDIYDRKIGESSDLPDPRM